MRSPVLALLVYLTTFAMCLLGAAGVLIVVVLLIAVDIAIGIVRRDLKTRIRRPRW